MLHSDERYINPLTDFGFKRIFGTPFNKDLLIDFLNALLEGEREVSDVQYRNSENLGTNEKERRAIFDVYCQSKDGSRFIVEMQNVYQEFYKDRSIYYSTFPISEQNKRGDWNYQLQPVYTIGILNFTFPEDKQGENGVYKEVKLMDVNNKTVFYDKLTYIYVELANFNKTEDELETTRDKWIYVLKNLQGLFERPAALQGRVFEKLFRTAEISKFNTEELREYEQSVNAYRDIKNGMDAAKAEGFKKGKAEGRAKGLEEGSRNTALNHARRMKAKGFSDKDISDITGLSIEQIKNLTL
ncbi:MAG: Rpn family recombination-promoting nuclease/putative transposase [Prevotella sp.]|jgi:predicted transposase/invertase (TIGR01784 family)